MEKQKGEIATILAIVSMLILATGAIAGREAVKRGIIGLSGGEAECDNTNPAHLCNGTLSATAWVEMERGACDKIYKAGVDVPINVTKDKPSEFRFTNFAGATSVEPMTGTSGRGFVFFGNIDYVPGETADTATLVYKYPEEVNGGAAWGWFRLEPCPNIGVGGKGYKKILRQGKPAIEVKIAADDFGSLRNLMVPFVFRPAKELSPTVTPALTSTPTLTPTPMPTLTPTLTPTATLTPTPMTTISPTPTPTPAPTSILTPTSTPTLSPTSTPTPTPTPPSAAGQTVQLDWTLDGKGICWSAWTNACSGIAPNIGKDAGYDRIECSGTRGNVTITNNTGEELTLACEKFVCDSCFAEDGKAKCESGSPYNGRRDVIRDNVNVPDGRSATCREDGGVEVSPPEQGPTTSPSSCGECNGDQWGGCTPPNECVWVNESEVCLRNNKGGAPCCLWDQSCGGGGVSAPGDLNGDGVYSIAEDWTVIINSFDKEVDTYRGRKLVTIRTISDFLTGWNAQ